jgi:hypothetical protein
MRPGLAVVLPGESLVVAVSVSRLKMRWESVFESLSRHVVDVIYSLRI